MDYECLQGQPIQFVEIFKLKSKTINLQQDHCHPNTFLMGANHSKEPSTSNFSLKQDPATLFGDMSSQKQRFISRFIINKDSLIQTWTQIYVYLHETKWKRESQTLVFQPVWRLSTKHSSLLPQSSPSLPASSWTEWEQAVIWTWVQRDRVTPSPIKCWCSRRSDSVIDWPLQQCSQPIEDLSAKLTCNTKSLSTPNQSL